MYWKRGREQDGKWKGRWARKFFGNGGENWERKQNVGKSCESKGKTVGRRTVKGNEGR